MTFYRVAPSSIDDFLKNRDEMPVGPGTYELKDRGTPVIEKPRPELGIMPDH